MNASQFYVTRDLISRAMEYTFKVYILIFQAFSDQWQQSTRNIYLFTPVKQLNLKIMYISNSVIFSNFLKDISKTICLSVYSDLSVQRYSKPRNLYEAEKQLARGTLI